MYSNEVHNSLTVLLQPDGPLRELITGYRAVTDDPFALDIRIRGVDDLEFHHGTTVVLFIDFDASRQLVYFLGGTYCGNHYWRQYGENYADDLGWIVDTFPLAEAAKALELLPYYLRSAVSASDDACYRDRRRGFWLNWLSLSLGHDWHPAREWLAVDRVCTIPVPRGCVGLSVFVYSGFRRFEILKHRLQQTDPQHWGPPVPDGLSRECDLIGVGPNGELLCIDVRHGGDGMDICWSAVKLAAYAEALRTADPVELFNDLTEPLRRLVALGLLPREALSRWPASAFSRIVPVLVVAEPDPNSPCWEQLDELAQYEPAARVKVIRVQCGQSADQISLRR